MRKYRFKQVENYIALFRKLNEGIFGSFKKWGWYEQGTGIS